ncbi:TraR/DksA family transcriptional regulator [Serratia liquefaciens]|uniref:TraR/DksA family transcriptional regulator n=1 Tax=Serratia liquefaciens TaxID=614 RepID=UPI001C2BB8ED|nr:TraR/DksA family transcriptional regulator [Serratia liquefaciens]
MADQIDMAQERHQLILDAQIKNARSQPRGPSALHCEECGSSIPEPRRRLIHGVTTCVHCQAIREAKSRHTKFQGKPSPRNEDVNAGWMQKIKLGNSE